MFRLGVKIFLAVAWGCVGLVYIITKCKDMRAEKEEKYIKQHKFELLNYVLVYLTMMMLLVENAVDVATGL